VFDETNLAADFDWTTKGAVTPVKNQGQCGSCWAFSTTGSLEGANFIANGKLESFSEQELVDCAGSFGNQGCNGGLMDDGFKYIEAKGDALDSVYPYTGKSGTCDTAKQSANAFKPDCLTSFHDVTTDSETQMMAAVAAGPVSVAIEADQSGFQFYKNGVFSGTCGNNLDHGVLAVGYGTDSGKDYWKIKNSWAATWGDHGYIRVARGSGNITAGRKLLGGGGGSADGECGLLKQPSFPIVCKETNNDWWDAAKTHYGNPTAGCMADEQAVQVQGLSGKFCSPDCASAACPTDVPTGTTAAPQCALKTSAGDKRCALICSPSTDEASLRAGDAQCGAATCQPIQTVGICTYAAAKAEAPAADCTLATGLACGKALEGCVATCKTGAAACVKCLAGDFATCCPCLKKLDAKLPISCGGDVVPQFMEVITK